MGRPTRIIAENIYFGECPRWRKGRLWFSDFFAHAVKSVSLAGDVRTELEMDDQPAGLGWMPDGSLLIVSMEKQTVVRRWRDGRVTMHAQLPKTGFRSNDMVERGGECVGGASAGAGVFSGGAGWRGAGGDRYGGDLLCVHAGRGRRADAVDARGADVVSAGAGSSACGEAAGSQRGCSARWFGRRSIGSLEENLQGELKLARIGVGGGLRDGSKAASAGGRVSGDRADEGIDGLREG